MIVKLLTEHHLEFPSLKGGCRGWSESTHVKMPHCWKSHVAAYLSLQEKLAFLHGLYQRLLAGRIVIPLKEKTFNQFSWHDLTNMVFEQVSTLINNMQSAEEKVRIHKCR